VERRCRVVEQQQHAMRTHVAASVQPLQIPRLGSPLLHRRCRSRTDAPLVERPWEYWRREFVPPRRGRHAVEPPWGVWEEEEPPWGPPGQEEELSMGRTGDDGHWEKATGSDLRIGS